MHHAPSKYIQFLGLDRRGQKCYATVILIILATFINPIDEKLDLVSVQGWAAKRHAAAINAFDDKAAFTVAGDKPGTRVSALFESIVLGEIKPSANWGGVAPWVATAFSEYRLNIVLEGNSCNNGLFNDWLFNNPRLWRLSRRGRRCSGLEDIRHTGSVFGGIAFITATGDEDRNEKKTNGKNGNRNGTDVSFTHTYKRCNNHDRILLF